MNEYEELVEWHKRGKNEVLGDKPVQVPVPSPQIPTWINLGLKTGLRNEKPTTPRHGLQTVCWICAHYFSSTSKGKGLERRC
jgi:hypothetical protein